MFWNRRVERLYQLFGAKIVGPAPGANVRPAADGRLLLHDGRVAEGAFAVASTRMTLFGELRATTPAHLGLWRIEPPLRLSTRRSGIDATGVVSEAASFVVYDCRGGNLELTLRSPAEQEIELLVGGKVRRVLLQVERPWSATIPFEAPDSARPRTCRFGIRGVDRPLRAERLDFIRAA
jgi:hypothetical protein